MKQDKIFAGTVIAAAFWFVVNPDFHYRTASANRDPAMTLSEKASLKGAPGGSANIGSRTRYENILVKFAVTGNLCTGTVLESPVSVGSTILVPSAWKCADGALEVRGAALFDPSKDLFSDFESNVTQDDAPLDRAIVARWTNYGTLCPNDKCDPSDLVVLDDGNVQVRKPGVSTLGTEIGKLNRDEVVLLKSYFEKLIQTPRVEHRIDDVKTSEPVAMLWELNYLAGAFIEADYLHASVRYPPIPEASLACAIIEEKTPLHFCDLLTVEAIPSPTPSSGTLKLPPVFHDPGHLPPTQGPSSGIPPVIYHPNIPPANPPGLPTPPTPPTPPSPPSPQTNHPTDPSTESSPRYGSDEPIKAGARGLTWNNMRHEGLADGYSAVGCHGKWECNAYQGNAACTESMPLLCIRKDSTITAPPKTPELNVIYWTWASGEVKSVPGVSGTRLTSVNAANAICSNAFGEGWKMAEHHDGWGWGFVAKGTLEIEQRFWVWINDQPANCWNSH
jgi:hypothetical protein